MADEALRLTGVDFTTERANKEHEVYRTTQHAADITALAKANAVHAYRTGGRGPTAYQVDQAGDAKKKPYRSARNNRRDAPMRCHSSRAACT